MCHHQRVKLVLIQKPPEVLVDRSDVSMNSTTYQAAAKAFHSLCEVSASSHINRYDG